MPPWLGAAPPHLRGPLSRAAAGQPANVALMQVLMECSDPDEARRAIDAASRSAAAAGDGASAERLLAVLDLLRATPGAFAMVRSVLAGLDHQQEPEGDRLAYWSAAFDRAAREHPEAGVALYAFGNADLLASATNEVVDRMTDWGLLAPGADCLDIGCGIGRFERALSGRMRRVVGIDISAAMIEAARQRTADLPNVEFRRASGRDLAGFADASFDLVLTVDAFPYIVDAGGKLAAAMIREAARVLRPAGHLAVFNYSYRGDRAQDERDLAAFGAAAGLAMVRDSGADFHLWDADTFILRRRATAELSR